MHHRKRRRRKAGQRGVDRRRDRVRRSGHLRLGRTRCRIGRRRRRRRRRRCRRRRAAAAAPSTGRETEGQSRDRRGRSQFSVHRHRSEALLILKRPRREPRASGFRADRRAEDRARGRGGAVEAVVSAGIFRAVSGPPVPGGRRPGGDGPGKPIPEASETMTEAGGAITGTARTDYPEPRHMHTLKVVTV